MDKLKAVWAWIVRAYDWITASIASHPGATFWVVVALLFIVRMIP